MGGAPLAAELYRLRGEALLAGAGTVSEAETAIEQAIRRRAPAETRRLGIRGAMSLRRQQGRREEATGLLAPILGWFTEGFDTADLKAARTLLDEIASSLCSSQ